MNATSGDYDKDVDEFEHAGLLRAPCETIQCSRVDGAPAALECRLTEIVQLKGEANCMVLGEVTGIHLRDDCLSDGRFDVLKYQPLARSGYRDYARITELFEMIRPSE
jgi:flavin reductase (DIM6/NTAB) family NADH-FMN oxidoreductase RutF